MASLTVRRLNGEVIRRLKIRVQRDGLSLEETVRRILADAVVEVEPAGAMIRRIIGDDAGARPRLSDRLHIRRLRPGRSRMISAAFTGKVDVREAVPR